MEGLVGAQLSSTSVLFEWFPPYTLTGVAILGYELHVYVTDDLNKDVQTVYNTTVNVTRFVYNNLNGSGNCTMVNITIFAINMVGHGHSVEYMFTFTASKPLNDLIFAVCKE